MPKRYEELKSQLPVSRLSIDVLLALRVLYDKPENDVELHQQITELSREPSKLEREYRSEWEAYVLRELVLDLKQNTQRSPAIFIDSVLSRIESLKESCPYYKAYKQQISQATPADDSTTQLFPTPWRQQLMMLLLPVTTVKPLKPTE
ncbi:hypothetical protein J5X92_03200 [Alteromonas sp. K632G]|uniref:hypothetical protein n=1 Tax=Alteromonas sp. K632G TaxID=2820757 RepID=UPI000C48B8D2|nr:hypothetical protein [Alteromonas sp. K632G]MBB67897.1 hypothetical protein [Rickettsiales bacterium]MBO7921221.1 hypothetical protein [Alteromonas sp. K632G]